MLLRSCKVFFIPLFLPIQLDYYCPSAVNVMGHDMTICPILLKIFDIAEMH